jgi:hypothetical protein
MTKNFKRDFIPPTEVGEKRKKRLVKECKKRDMSIRQYLNQLLDKEFAK